MRRLAIVACLSIFGLLLSTLPLSSHASTAAVSDGERRLGYAALGDSVAAGFGLRIRRGASNQDKLCKRSLKAYPQIIARKQGFRLQHVACRGAKFDEGLYGQQEIGNRELPEQIRRVFRGYTPRRMSISVGANDMRWHYFVAKCYVSRCGTGADRDFLALLRADMRFEQWRARKEIEFRSWLNNTREPRTVLSGYYNPFSVVKCHQTNGVSRVERRWIRHAVKVINFELRRSAGEEAWLHYAGVNKRYQGHRLCSDASWVAGPRSKGSLHPTHSGQRAYARAVSSKF